MRQSVPTALRFAAHAELACLFLCLLGGSAGAQAPHRAESSVEGAESEARASVAADSTWAERLAAAGLELDELGRTRLFAASARPELPPSPGNALADDERAAEFGRLLFYDTRLSGYQSISCAGCHPPERAFTNGSMSFRGHEGLRRRTPSLVNVAYYRWFGQDGRADSLWAQALGPLEDIGEHDTSRVQVARVVAADEEYARLYTELFGALPDLADYPEFGKPVPYHTGHRHHLAWLEMAPEQRQASSRVFANLGKALEAFERRLVTGPAPFDRFVEGLGSGDSRALSALDAPARRGLELFFGRADCARCHSGPTFTDNAFHDTRVPVLEPDHRDPARTLGLAKLAATEFGTWGEFADDPTPAPEWPAADEQFGLWRTTSLRIPSPRGFTHEHTFRGLEDLVRHYSTLDGALDPAAGRPSELEPLELTEQEIQDLMRFVESLEGEPVPERWRRRPRR